MTITHSVGRSPLVAGYLILNVRLRTLSIACETSPTELQHSRNVNGVRVQDPGHQDRSGTGPNTQLDDSSISIPTNLPDHPGVEVKQRSPTHVAYL